MNNDSENLALLYEAIAKATKSSLPLPKDPKKLANLIFSKTNGGTESFTLWTIRKTDSKHDPKKKAGDEMVINGRLKIPKSKIKGIGSTSGSAREFFDKYGNLRIYVNSVDGRSYLTSSRAEDRIRAFSVPNIFRLSIGREIFQK
jgi:hypothetical protein